MLRWIRLSTGLVFVGLMPLSIKATGLYKLRQITTASVGFTGRGASPYFRWVRWLFPTSDGSIIHRAVAFKSGAVFSPGDLLRIRKKLLDLPYFSFVSVASKPLENAVDRADIVIQTRDRFPISASVSLAEGALVTITHNNGWGYGHIIRNRLLLKTRRGYGLEYELPSRAGSCFLGGQVDKQQAKPYEFVSQDLWIGKTFLVKAFPATYWLAALRRCNQYLVPSPLGSKHGIFCDNRLVLGKLGWVSDGYQTVKGLYSLNRRERLPKGGSVAIVYGYQTSKHNDQRNYFGVNLIKNIVHASLAHIHLNFSAGGFLHKNHLEEGILKCTLDYIGPLCAAVRCCSWLHLDYIGGFRMPLERRLGIAYRDVEGLAQPMSSDLGPIVQPICTRLNIDLTTTLHRPFMVKSLRCVWIGFTNFIALFDHNNVLLNMTLVKSCGLGLRLAHVKWSTLECTMAYSPLLSKFMPSVQWSICRLQNATAPKPLLIAYS